jgi:hypothetical protein
MSVASTSVSVSVLKTRPALLEQLLEGGVVLDDPVVDDADGAGSVVGVRVTC